MNEKTTLAERLTLALSDSGLKKSDIARLCSISPASVSDWFTGKSKSIKSIYLPKVAKLLGVSSTWLATGNGPMKSPNVLVTEEVCDDDDWVEIPEYKIRFAAGFEQNSTLEELASEYKAAYRRSWFQRKNINPEDCKRFKVKRDSMEPLLLDHDVVLVDCSKTEIIDGRIYAFVYGDALRVKRLYRKIDGSIMVHSENPNFQDETIKPEDTEQVQIIGEVIERSGSVYSARRYT